MAATSVAALAAPRLGAPARAPRKVFPRASCARSDNVDGTVVVRSRTRHARSRWRPSGAPLGLRASRSRLVQTPGAIANPEPEPPRAGTEDDAPVVFTFASRDDEDLGASGTTETSPRDSGVVTVEVEPSAFHSMDDEFDAIAAAHAETEAAAAAARPRPSPPSRTVVVGGGPTGLATAIMMARRGWENVEVWERLRRPARPDDTAVWGDPDRSYNVGVSGRGQIALEKLGACERVLRYCKQVNGRMDWSPQNPNGVTRLTEKKYATQVIQRDRLVAVLLEEIEEKYSDKVTVFHETACAACEWLPGGGATLTREPAERIEKREDEDVGETADAVSAATSAAQVAADADETKTPYADAARVRVVEPFVPFVVGAEGATRRNAVLSAMDGDGGVRVTRYADTNPRVYKTIPIDLPEPEFRSDLNYSARTKDGVALECLPTKEGMLVGILLVKPGDAKTCAILESKHKLREYFDTQFPMFAPYVSDEDLARMAKRRLSALPTFSHAGGESAHRVDTSLLASSDAHYAKKGCKDTLELELGGACLLGDSIHTVKPYFGLGVNSAFEDVCVLDACLDEISAGDATGDVSWTSALPLFSARRAADAKALVDISRGFDGGFLTFVLPLILDGVFHKAFPNVFMPNTIQMLQKEDWTFSRVARRKRAERVAQVAILSTLLAAVAWLVGKAAKAAFGAIARALATGAA
jgi:2-polyprenyl-6-methoxyphenol hydroxylase-like FAD-dependent oxidoreductase